MINKRSDVDFNKFRAMAAKVLGDFEGLSFIVLQRLNLVCCGGTVEAHSFWRHNDNDVRSTS